MMVCRAAGREESRQPSAPLHTPADIVLIALRRKRIPRLVPGAVAEKACGHDVHAVFCPTFRLGLQVFSCASEQIGLRFGQAETC